MPHRVTSIAASAAITTAPCYVYGIHIEAAADAATVALANKATSGGTRVMGAKAAINGSDNAHFSGDPVFFGTGCYATITGTTPIIEIHWSPVKGNAS
uniref:Uncharacterized protein n=1 Tax=viral metagenome TaxID=1070528 RepID=A0A6M3J0F6_9ZZZZ